VVFPSPFSFFKSIWYLLSQFNNVVSSSLNILLVLNWSFVVVVGFLIMRQRYMFSYRIFFWYSVSTSLPWFFLLKDDYFSCWG
jgi:hypothetical protein